MKKLNLSIILAICIGLLVTTSCKKDNNNDGISPNDGCTASWTVNGTNYSEDDMTICVYLDNTLNLSASASGGDFQLQVDPITSTGTYQVDASDPNQNVIVLIKLNDGKQIGIKSGQVSVTELSSSKAKGTFSGAFFDIMDINQTPNYTVTNGQFSANF